MSNNKQWDDQREAMYSAWEKKQVQGEPENKPMTAEEYFERNFVKFKGEYFISRSDFMAFGEGVEQQTAALREELQGEKVMNEILNKATKELETELEAVKKERAALEHKYRDFDSIKALADAVPLLNEVIKKVNTERDEAVKLLDDACELLGSPSYVHPFVERVELYKGRLSSGETKPIEKSDSKVCEQQCSYESIQNNDCHCFGPEEEAKPVSPWISVEDRLPEVGQDIRAWHKLTGNTWSFKYHNGAKTVVNMWHPLPAPPESSNQNEQK